MAGAFGAVIRLRREALHAQLAAPRAPAFEQRADGLLAGMHVVEQRVAET